MVMSGPVWSFFIWAVVIALIVLLIYLVVLSLVSIIDCFKRDDINIVQKLLWLIVILLFSYPLIGNLIYYYGSYRKRYPTPRRILYIFKI